MDGRDERRQVQWYRRASLEDEMLAEAVSEFPELGSAGGYR